MFPWHFGSRPFLWSGYRVIPQFTNIFDFKGGEQRLWENVNQSVRKSVNKATKNGIIVETDSKSDIDLLFKSRENRNRIHSPESFFPDILKIFIRTISISSLPKKRI
jgi:hypothetical protein